MRKVVWKMRQQQQQQQLQTLIKPQASNTTHFARCAAGYNRLR